MTKAKTKTKSSIEDNGSLTKAATPAVSTKRPRGADRNVAAKADPLLQIPGAAGAGLDVPRLAILAAVILAVVVTAVSSARRAIARRREELA